MWSLGDVECGRVDVIPVKDCKQGLDSGNFLKKILDVATASSERDLMTLLGGQKDAANGDGGAGNDVNWN
ncbi:hypothetical protein L195_g046540 [Trifolium pratense]|uniref:Uncharacterized protein n=1 Tax=Trifolium pratense TaxID=57577 RepID=A0A2K3MI10_TRIPR|nr:hypothetical protein L195_g046540 [Trifolium pratense]